MLDIFKGDAFSVVSLTDALNNLKFVPGRIAEMGLFNPPSGVTTTSIAIEQKDGQLILIPPTPRGGPGITMDKTKRSIRNLSIPHFEINDAIMAEEVQGIRAFGQETAVETVMGKVADRGSEASQSFAATTEYAQIGAVKGIVTYADGTTLNLFTEFGVVAQTEVDFSFDTNKDGLLRKQCAAVIRLIANELGGLPWSGRVRAFCSDQFFDDLIANVEFRESYLGWSDAKILREGYIEPNGKSYGAVEFGGIIFENYRGSVGATKYVEDDKAYLFPEGVPGLFRTYHAPADYIETVNTVGQRMYAKMYAMQNDKGMHMDTQMNELNICTRPRVLVKAKRT